MIAVVRYDRTRQRVWVFRVRVHHGLVGVGLVAAGAGLHSSVGIGLLVLGAGLVLHDWGDRWWLSDQQ